jgi:RNA polymerase sigma-70 factor (ECF subfamily)
MREETLVRNLLTYKGVVTGMITAMVGDPEVAEDLFQEVAVVMTRKREQAGEDCRFVAWARSIAVNVVRDYRKKQARRRVRLLDDEALEAVALTFEEIDEPVWDLRRQALRTCADELPDRDRLLLRKRYEEGVPIETLARDLSMSRGAMDTLLYRLRKALHACVDVRVQKQGVS